MAKKLKCWRKVRKDKIGELYYNKNRKEYVQRRSPFKDVHVVNVYDATNKNIPSLLFEKEFKTRKSSEKHSNQYMRKHDKC